MAKKIVSNEDSSLFRQAVGKVNRIKNNKILAQGSAKPKPFPNKKTYVERDPQIEALSDLITEKVGNEDNLNYLAPGIQHKVLKKLRQGYYGSTAELDLHGLTSNEAKHQLLTFLRFCIEEGFRCAHIIHGKGYRSAANHPVLKNHINIWLRQHENVLAFCSTPARQGGTGAVFVLLQTKNKFDQEY